MHVRERVGRGLRLFVHEGVASKPNSRRCTSKRFNLPGRRVPTNPNRFARTPSRGVGGERIPKRYNSHFIESTSLETNELSPYRRSAHG